MTCIALTPGEPSGIGPDITLQITVDEWPFGLCAIADPDLLAARAAQLALDIQIEQCDADNLPTVHTPGTLYCLPVKLNATATPGKLDPVNAEYVLQALSIAVACCVQKKCSALVTGPVHKGVINDSGTHFTGQTEFIANLCDVEKPVMMLASDDLRVALATTHMPLANVPTQLAPDKLTQVLRVLQHDLVHRFKIAEPRILVCGLNPHAGEGGHLGREEIDIVIPTLETLRAEGLNLQGPLPADTVFTPRYLDQADAILAMYHDQGLAPLKALAFSKAVNITLGLPIIRTSVDHGTALDLAGTGGASPSSLRCALTQAVQLS